MKNPPTSRMYSLFDFDYTIYDGNSAVDFYISCIRKNPLLSVYLFVQVFHLIKYVLRLESKDEFKGHYFGFVGYITENKDEYVKYFWQMNLKKVKSWYVVREDHSKDIIVTASPYYYLEWFRKKYDIAYLIATSIDDDTGKLIGPNCYGEEKIRRIRREIPSGRFVEAFTDSLSDVPMLRLADRAYLVKRGKIKNISIDR